MRFYLVFAFFLLATGAVSAQTAPPISRLDSALAISQAQVQALQAQAQAQVLQAQAQAATDTAAALHRLFMRRRQRGHLLAAGLVGFTALSVGVVNNTSRPYEFQGLFQAAFVVVVVVPLLIGSFAYHAQYNHRRERRAVEAFERHQLPAAVKSQLQRQFFELPTKAMGR
ncbi:hypothetical protein [Hymenobacter caeli]